MPKPVLIIGAVVCLLLLLLLGWLDWRRMGEQRDAALREAAALHDQLAAAAATNATVETEVQGLRAHAAELERAASEAAKARDTLETQMRSALDTKDVTISALQGRLTVNILDQVLFDSGRALLRPEGQAILQKVGKVLEQFPGRRVEVVGHTDNTPVRGRTPEGFTDNWGLSAGRALSAVRFLIESGLQPARCSAAGCGEFRPVADNASNEGKARNRRIEVIVLPDLGTNTPPAQNQTGAAAPTPAGPAEPAPAK